MSRKDPKPAKPAEPKQAPKGQTGSNNTAKGDEYVPFQIHLTK